MNDSYLLDFKGEQTLFERRNGKIYAQGYDLEAERAAMILTGAFGEGVNIVLLALGEYKGEGTLKEILEYLPSDIEALGTNVSFFVDRHNPSKKDPPRSPLSHLYLSFSPDEFRRSTAALQGGFSSTTWNRLLHDPKERVVEVALKRASGPVKELRKFLEHRNAFYRQKLAENPHLSVSALIHLANDPSLGVRNALLTRSEPIPGFVAKLIKARNREQKARSWRQRSDAMLERTEKSLAKLAKTIEEKSIPPQDFEV